MNQAWRYRKYRTCLVWPTECEWCGDNFKFYARVKEDGSPVDKLRFCGRKCQAEARWEGKKKTPSAKTLEYLYVMRSMSIPKIAAKLSCSNPVIWKALHTYGIAVRSHTSTRFCKECGSPVDKKFHSRRDSDGRRIIFGTLCASHRRDYFAKWAREKAHRLDPLIGTRKTGRKGKPTSCQKCTKIWPSARRAVKCCSGLRGKVQAANDALKSEAA